jgi:uncharacterized repeat protein (TIGR02543 family)
MGARKMLPKSLKAFRGNSRTRQGKSGILGIAVLLCLLLTATPARAAFSTITFDGNGSTGGATASQTVGSSPLTSNGFTRTGYSFSGWNSAASGSGTAYADGASFSFGSEITLYAQWTQIAVVAHLSSLAFTANASGGSGRLTWTGTDISKVRFSGNAKNYPSP